MALNVLIKTALDNAALTDPLFAPGEIRHKLEIALHDAVLAVMPKLLTLDSTKPDFESIMLRLVQELQGDKTWYDLVPSGTGTTLLRNISAGFAALLHANERALQEAMLGAAFSPNSIMMATRMLGVNPRRRVPARVSVRLTRQDTGDTLTIPRFSEFSINNLPFFNREPIIFTPFDVNLVVTLLQGQILSMEAVAEGSPYERIEIGTESGLISQEDVYVSVNNEEWGTNTIGPYNFGADEKTVYVATLPNSNVEIQFGDNRYGAMAPAEAAVKITWAETEGEVQNLTASGLGVQYTNAPSGVVVSGITTSPVYGGGEALGPDFYKLHAPHIRAANKRGVRRSDYRAIAMEYPGVADALFRGQAELNPSKRSWMNVYGITILTKSGTPWSDLEWTAFTEYMNKSVADRLEWIRFDPEPVEIEIAGKVYCRPNADLEKIKQLLKQDLTKAYEPRPNALGYNIYYSDIAKKLEGGDDYKHFIEYATDIWPAIDNVLDSKTKFIRVTALNIETFYTSRNGYTGRVDLY